MGWVSGFSERGCRRAKAWCWSLAALVVCAAWLLEAPVVARAVAPSARLTIDAGRVGPAINPTQFGAFLEEINHSGDGGLYGELIRNRDLKEDPNAPVYWSRFTSKGSTARIALDSTEPLNSANPVSLKLSIGTITAGGSAGVANWGYWGDARAPGPGPRALRGRQTLGRGA